MPTGGGMQDHVARVALALLLCVTPWPMGSRLPWASTWSASAAIVLVCIWGGVRLLRGGVPAGPRVLLPVAAFLAVAGFQLAFHASVYPLATEMGIRAIVAAAAVLALTYFTDRGPGSRRGLLLVLVGVGLAAAIFAIVQHLTWNGLMFWFYEPPMGGSSPFGSFNNRNHYAGYMIAILGPAMGLLVARATGLWRLLAGSLVTVGVLSVLLSGSRGGVLGLVAAAGAALVGAALLRGKGMHGIGWRQLVRPAAAFVVVAMLVGAGVGLLGQTAPVLDRLSTFLGIAGDSSAEGRFVIWRDTLRMIAANPWLGTGLDTFVWGHLPYRSVTTGIPQHAHNEYLEVVAETGVIGGVICVWFLTLLWRGMIRGYRDAPDGFEAGLRLGAMASWAGIMVYALTDFPTVIPATNYVLATLAGLALVPPDGVGGTPTPSAETA